MTMANEGKGKGNSDLLSHIVWAWAREYLARQGNSDPMAMGAIAGYIQTGGESEGIDVHHELVLQPPMLFGITGVVRIPVTEEFFFSNQLPLLSMAPDADEMQMKRFLDVFGVSIIAAYQLQWAVQEQEKTTSKVLDDGTVKGVLEA